MTSRVPSLFGSTVGQSTAVTHAREAWAQAEAERAAALLGAPEMSAALPPPAPRPLPAVLMPLAAVPPVVYVVAGAAILWWAWRRR